MDILIAGGGIAGLAAALACRRAGHAVQLFEQAAQFTEVGAGIQLGPNAVRVLRGFGLAQALEAVAGRPTHLSVRCAERGVELGRLDFGAAFERRHGAPYRTVHRADLHRLLLDAVLAAGDTQLTPGAAVRPAVADAGDGVVIELADGRPIRGQLLLGAQGVWGELGRDWPGHAAPRYSGHLAWRALLAQEALPAALRSGCVTAWLGRGLHLVSYPVRGGSALNVAGFIEGPCPPDLRNWDLAPDDLPSDAGGLPAALRRSAPALAALAEAVPHWRLWALAGRRPVSGPGDLVRGRVALLGDAAHPMLPYLAQGAGMALEDAAVLGHCLAGADAAAAPQRLAAYAAQRWRRVARVQRRALANARIFHAGGVMRLARNAAMRALGERLLDLPWLYGRGPVGTSDSGSLSER